MKRSILFGCACLVFFAYGCSKASDDSTSSSSTSSSSKPAGDAGPKTTGAYAAVQAIFDKSCMPCHGAGGRRGPAGGVDLSNYDGVMKGGKSGPVVVAGDPTNSELVKQISGATPSMPKNKPPLSADDVKTISDWIKAGAKNG